MKLKVSTADAALSQFPASSYISTSGVYDITIKFASVDVSTGGAESVNFNVDYQGNPVTLYGPYVQDKQGNVLAIGAKIINGLAVIAGMQDGDDYVMEKEDHAVGKDNEVKTFNVITNFTDLPCKVQVQEEWTLNPNTKQPRKSIVIKNFFSEDGATASELKSGKDKGKQLAIVLEKYASNITYKDGLTKEVVDEFKAAQKAGKPTPQPKVAAAKPATSLFR